MTSASPSVYSLPNAELVPEEKPFIEDGDAAIILRRNGDIIPVTIGVDPDRARILLETVGRRVLTAEEQQTIEQGRRLFALTMAAQSPVIMTILYELMDNPELFDAEKLEQLRKPN